MDNKTIDFINSEIKTKMEKLQSLEDEVLTLKERKKEYDVTIKLSAGDDIKVFKEQIKEIKESMQQSKNRIDELKDKIQYVKDDAIKDSLDEYNEIIERQKSIKLELKEIITNISNLQELVNKMDKI